MTGDDPRLKFYIEFLTRHRDLLKPNQELWFKRYLEAAWEKKGKISDKQYAGIMRIYESLTTEYPDLV